ncbi:MAG: TRAP transporter substrate-binding protein [Cardiobacteriaceae bacterium]|nr:TRAP transporter substrate-binding protein [Cardiobacteriaceae bacterium]
MKRRDILKAGGGLVALGGAAAVKAAEKAEFKWKMVMTWPKKFPGVGTNAEWFAEQVGKITDGRVAITLYGAGELVPPFEVFHALRDGIADCAHGPAYYNKGLVPEAEIFSAIPFGMTPLELSAWFEFGGATELLNELYKPFGVMMAPGGNSDIQMGGWFNKEINTVEDLKGLKIRAPGVTGEVFKILGATPVAMPGSEVFTSMQSGVIDAADWIGPWNDQAFGLQKVAKYYYGTWHESGAASDYMFNIKSFEALPENLRDQVLMVARAAAARQTLDYRAHNGVALKNLIEKDGVQLRYYNDEILKAMYAATQQYLEAFAKKSDMAAKALQSYRDFQNNQQIWSDNEAKYLAARKAVMS